MVFTLPDFNLAGNWWPSPTVPPALPAGTFPCQVYVVSRTFLDVTPGSPGLWVPPIILRFPLANLMLAGDLVEVPAGSGRFLDIRWTDRIHRGFPNEYRVAVCEHDPTFDVPD